MSDNVVIRVEGLWKRYGLPLKPALRRLTRALRFGSDHRVPTTDDGRPTTGHESSSIVQDDGPWALRDVSFEVKRGETLGIIGRNGAGKSTLLKVLAGVTPPTRGRVEVGGRVFPMIELNAGLHMELTGRENVRLLGAIMGFSRQEIEAKMPEIEKFCELGEWFDRPVRMYSSGMLARLGFGVAVNVDAEILLVDEVLAIGDVGFQRKCLDRITRMLSDGITLLLVSHNPYLVERMCSQSVLMTKGILRHQGEPNEIMALYFEEVARAGMANHLVHGNGVQFPVTRPGTGQVRLERLEVLSDSGQPVEQIEVGACVTFRLHLRMYETVCKPHMHIALYDVSNTLVAHFQAYPDAREKLILDGDGYIDCTIEYLPLMPGKYSIGVKIGGGDILIDVVSNAGDLAISGSPDILLATSNRGLVYAPATWKFSRRDT
jgi:lipopolysaccharide transport system ATP-binding protein